jgi:hypothetical protein
VNCRKSVVGYGFDPAAVYIDASLAYRLKVVQLGLRWVQKEGNEVLVREKVAQKLSRTKSYLQTERLQHEVGVVAQSHA